jgi:radical SAM superfamily enzyme YgiQ (UPF0313 family)
MKVKLIYPDLQPRWPFWSGHYYVGIVSLSAYLKKHGHDVSLMHIIRPKKKEEFIQNIVDESPGLIGFSSTSHGFSVVKEIAGWLKEENINIPVIYGGIHPTICPEDAINTEGVDMICRGEGEEPMLEVCRSLEDGDNSHNILNVWYKENGSIHRNNMRQPYPDLSVLPFPDRHIFNYMELLREMEGYATVMVSRGCPHKCSYCCNHILRRNYDKNVKYSRFRNVDSAINEIKQVLKDFPLLKGIHFDDDILFLNKKWGEEFMLRYRNEIAVPFSCNMRVNYINEKVIDLMSKAGCVEIAIGVESGNEYIRNKILNRNLSNDMMKNAVSFCKKENIYVRSFNMVGVPYEDASAILDTIKLNSELKIDDAQTSIFHPYKGTDLFDLCKEKGFLTPKASDIKIDYYTESPLKLDSISPEQIVMFRNYFKYIIKIYVVIFALPEGLSLFSERLSDKVFSSLFAARLLNKAHRPLNFLLRLGQVYKRKFTGKLVTRA